MAGYVAKCLEKVTAGETIEQERRRAIEEAAAALVRLREQLDDIQAGRQTPVAGHVREHAAPGRPLLCRTGRGNPPACRSENLVPDRL
ncbi:hypothetical protein [Amycolatopsis sp. NPDC054798]